MTLRSSLASESFAGAIQASAFVAGIIPARTLIVPTLVTENSDTTDGTLFTTASVTPAANRLHLLAVCSTHATAAESPSSVVGNTLTWVSGGAGSSGANSRRITWMYAFGAAPSAGTIAINFAGTMTTCTWALIACPGAALMAPRQATTANANSTTVTGTLASLYDAANMHIFCQSHAAVEVSAPPAAGGWAELSDRSVATPSGGMHVCWTTSGDLTADPTWTTSSAAVIVDLEIQAA